MSKTVMYALCSQTALCAFFSSTRNRGQITEEILSFTRGESLKTSKELEIANVNCEVYL